jgi:hypothetical protein
MLRQLELAPETDTDTRGQVWTEIMVPEIYLFSIYTSKHARALQTGFKMRRNQSLFHLILWPGQPERS